MNIGIDGYEANTDQRVGIGQYAFQLLKSLHSLDLKNRYTIFLPQKPLSDMPKEDTHWQYVVGTPGALWTIVQLPKLIKRQPLDIFFSPTHYAPWFSTLPKVLSVMDLSYIHYPEMFKTKDLLQLKYMGAISIKRAQKILTISNFTRKEIIGHYKYPEKDIEVTYPGFNGELHVRRRGLKTPDFVNGKYILFVGTIQPRKNIERLVAAFEALDQVDLKLVLVGKKGWLYEPILERIKSSPKREAIILRDYIKESELSALYEHATCFALPSLYEGFGIPVVEALMLGCPVVISNTTSLPEVGGAAAITIDPLDITDIARGLREAVQLTKTEREKSVKLGREHIKQFNWENCAKKTIAVFESIKP